jgi:putative FmdB family regulatory protein
MPMYEYRCEEDGSVITLMRPMAEADRPVEDPEGKGRTFRRIHSTFSVGAAPASSGDNAGFCPTCCGPPGSCGLPG